MLCQIYREWKINPNENDKKSLSFGMKVRQYFRNAEKNYERKGDESFKIWKECPKLEMLSVSVINGDKVSDVRYVREYGNKPFWGWSGPEDALDRVNVEEDTVDDEEVQTDDDEEIEDEEEI